jgi:RNA polymerase sigma factor (sigma-70 family)
MGARTAMDPPAMPSHDPVLLPFLRTPDVAQGERLLAELLGDRATSTIRDVVRRVLYTHLPAGVASLGEDVEDVSSEAIARVLGRLRQLKAGAAAEPIQNFDAYAARVATHVCYEHFRRRHPERARLRNQVWYVMTHSRDLTLQRSANGAWMCAFRGGRLEPAADVSSAAEWHGQSVPAVVRAVLVGLDAEMELNELVNRVGRTLGIGNSQPPFPTAGARSSAMEALPGRSVATPVTALENEEYLKRLWAEVQLLTLRQRTALLLNLRDAAGADALDLLPATGTATLRQIAGALAIEPEALARLWPKLPLEDRDIAARLGVTRQQVINLRKAARARLRRRLSAVETSAEWSGVGKIGNRGAVSNS